MRFGLIGLGYWGQNYVRLIGLTEAVELTAMCDTSAELVEFARGSAPSARTTCDPDEVLAADDVDAVVVATPTTTHFDARAGGARCAASTSSARSRSR